MESMQGQSQEEETFEAKILHYKVSPSREFFNSWSETMDKAGIANIEKENLQLQIDLLKKQVAMKRTPLSESLKE